MDQEESGVRGGRRGFEPDSGRMPSLAACSDGCRSGSRSTAALTASGWLNSDVKRAALVLTVLAFGAGCTAAVPTPTVERSVSGSPSSTTSERQTTPEEWASAIAPLRAKWLKENIR